MAVPIAGAPISAVDHIVVEVLELKGKNRRVLFVYLVNQIGSRSFTKGVRVRLGVFYRKYDDNVYDQ